MWSVPHHQREGSEQRDERLLRALENQIEELEACSSTIYWDGYCGLVKVTDEDLVRRDAQNAHQPAASPQQQAPQQQARLPDALQHRHAGSTGSGSAATRTPPSASPRASPRSSPFKAAPGAAPLDQQPAAVLAEQAAALLAQGRLHEAEAMLHAALRGCPAGDAQLAGRIVDLLLECEREWQETPTHSRAGSEGEQGEAGGDAVGGAQAASLLEQAKEALEAGEERRALQVLQSGLAVCPPELLELRRRIALYLELVTCKQYPY